VTGLNLACGSHADKADERWVSVDQWIGPDWLKPPQVLGRAGVLPFRDGCFDRLYLGHFCEHLEWDDMPVLGVEIRRVCTSGADVRIVGPDYDRARARREPDWLLEAIVEDPDRAAKPKGLVHAWTPTLSLTVLAAKKLGFDRVREVPVPDVARPRWPNASTALWQCALACRVP
jgi:hypothetical protein